MHGNMGGAPRCTSGTAASGHPSIPAQFEKKQNWRWDMAWEEVGRGLTMEVLG